MIAHRSLLFAPANRPADSLAKGMGAGPTPISAMRRPQ